MKAATWLILALLAASPLFAQDTAKPSTSDNKPKTTSAKAQEKGAKPAESPGWVIIEEDWFIPLRYEPYYSLDSIRSLYRRNEEKAAAKEIDKAVAWLKLAEGHAKPITREKLSAAATELTDVAKDLRDGKIAAAEKMDAALAKSAHALAEWHYYKAKESWGRSEEQDAGHDLQMAAQYLQHAADSAHYQFGADTVKVTTTLYEDGKEKSTTTSYNHNTLGMQLQQIEKAVKELGDVMAKK